MTNNSEIADQTPDPTLATVHFPSFFWAACILAAVNLVLIGWFAISPDDRFTLTQARVETVHAAGSKPSPFEKMVDESKPKRVSAKKAVPVAANEANVHAASYEAEHTLVIKASGERPVLF